MSLFTPSAVSQASSRDASGCTRGARSSAREAPTPRELATAADVVVICVSDTPDVEAVLFGDGGADIGDKLLVARTVEHDYHQVFYVTFHAFSDVLQVVGDRRIHVHRAVA